MSEWDQYRVSSTKPVENEWDQYRVSSKKPKTTEKGDSWLPLIGKSALKGATAIADVPRLGAETVEGMVNLARKTSGNPAEVYWAAQDPYDTKKPTIGTIENAPQTNYSKYVPSTQDARSSLKKYTGIDLEPKPDSPAKRIVSRGIDFGSYIMPWKAPAKGANLLSQFNNTANTVKKGSAIGLGSGALQEAGVDPLTADITSSVFTPDKLLNKKNLFNIGKGIATAHNRIPAKLMGLGPKRLNLKVAKDARDLDIDLPASVLTDSTLTGLGDQFISKTPILGNVLKNKYDKVQRKTHKHLEDVYNEIGPLDTPEIDKKISDLYEAGRNALPKDAIVKPTNTIKALNKIEDSLVSDVSSPDRGKLKGYINDLKSKLDPTINTQYGTVKLPLQDYRVDKLLDAKVNFNDIIKHDVKGDALNRLTEVNHAIKDDLAEYGTKNPEWYEKFKEADTLYGNVAKRKKTEKTLRQQGTLEQPEELSYSALNNSINNRENRRLLKRDLPPETYDKLIKLGRVSQAMVQKNRRIPNPSGTATTIASLGYLYNLVTNPVNTLNASGVAAIGSSLVATRLLTNKKFLDSAINFAEAESKNKITAAMRLNKQAKDITGYTLNSIYRAAQRNINQEEGADGLQ